MVRSNLILHEPHQGRKRKREVFPGMDSGLHTVTEGDASGSNRSQESPAVVREGIRSAPNELKGRWRRFHGSLLNWRSSKEAQNATEEGENQTRNARTFTPEFRQEAVREEKDTRRNIQTKEKEGEHASMIIYSVSNLARQTHSRECGKWFRWTRPSLSPWRRLAFQSLD